MRKVLAVGLAAIIAVAGCASAPKKVEPCWHPKDKNEMWMLIGTAVIQALYEYDQLQNRMKREKLDKMVPET